MKKFVGLVALVCLGAVGFAASHDPQFSLRAVVNFPEDAIDCAKDGGRGAMVFDLDEAGDSASEWKPFCILPVK